MDWFRQNPFLSGLIAATVVLGGAGLYFVSTESASLTEQTELYATHTGTLNRLQSSKPFPNDANRAAAQADLEAAESTLKKLSDTIASQSEPVKPLTPEQFQDELSKKVAATAAAATAASVQLPDGFYLGFDDYRTQPPSPDAAPLLGQQLNSIERSVAMLISSGVKSIVGIARPKLPVELPGGAPGKKDGQPPADKAAGGAMNLSLAPFDISFVSDQAAFRDAMAALTTSEPMVFIRLLSVANEQPVAPAKAAPEATPAPAADGTGGEPAIPVIFGQEMLNVTMRLAAISGSAGAAK